MRVLLGSAIQACWELCDLFREGDGRKSDQSAAHRDRLRPHSLKHSTKQNDPDLPLWTIIGNQRTLPETPTTIFEDTNVTNVSPDEAPLPNILVLGAEFAANRPSSTASTPAPGARSGAVRRPQSAHNPRQDDFGPQLASMQSLSAVTEQSDTVNPASAVSTENYQDSCRRSNSDSTQDPVRQSRHENPTWLYTYLI